MKRIISSLCFAGCLWTTAILPIEITKQVIAPSQAQETTSTAKNDTELYYLYYGQKISLRQRDNAIAVAFNTTRDIPRGGSFSEMLQKDLSGNNTRELTRTPQPAKPEVEVKALGDRYALIEFSAETSDQERKEITRKAETRSYVVSTLPVLNRNDSKDNSETIVLPNEITVSFEPKLTSSQIQLILNRNNLEIVRPLRFTQNRYVVRSRSATGTDILTASNQLNGITGVKSATPNFVQTLSYKFQEQRAGKINFSQESDAAQYLQKLRSRYVLANNGTFFSNLLPLQWHLNSTPQRGNYW